jgi:hypothetical protein
MVESAEEAGTSTTLNAAAPSWDEAHILNRGFAEVVY